MPKFIYAAITTFLVASIVTSWVTGNMMIWLWGALPVSVFTCCNAITALLTPKKTNTR